MLALSAFALAGFVPPPAGVPPSTALKSVTMNAEVSTGPAFEPPNLLKAAVLPFVEIGIVGLDRRRIENSLSRAARPLTALPRALERGLNSIVMTASAETEAPLVDQSLFPAMSVETIGNYGFDPLKLGTKTSLVPAREADIKHGRIAMLAAVAWPLQEIFHPIFAGMLNAPSMLAETSGASPSLLNGGLAQPEIAASLLLALGLGAFIEFKELDRRQPLGWWYYSYTRYPGNLGFDPLNIYRPLNEEGRRGMHEIELLNGRVAMMAILSYVVVEKVFGTPIVKATPDLFRPIILAPWFRAFMDSSFGMASMDGSIDGIAY